MVHWLMMMTPCSRCRRFIHDTETVCPFCARRGRLAGALMATAAALTACQGATQPQPETSQPPVAEVPATPTDETPANVDEQAGNPAPTPPEAPPAPEVAEDDEDVPAALVPEPTRPPREMVARYGIAPRLPPAPPKKP